MAAIDLNADLGEGMSEDAELTAQVTSANVACGFHAGDVETMAVTVRRAREHRVAVGAHPSYRDRENFGRSPMNPSPAALQADLEAQLTALAEVAVGAMVEVRYLKPHGALYNRIAIDPEQAEVVARVVAAAGLPLVGLPHSAIEAAADRLGVRFVREAFADRGYLPDGRLAPRGEVRARTEGAARPGDQHRARAVQIADRGEDLVRHVGRAGIEPLGPVQRDR